MDDVSFVVRDGAFFTLLGPSGSGKTTCLRMIAGFEQPTAGQIMLYGRDVTNLPAYDREVNTVFQDYALFPHMTVGDNIGYGLMVRKVAKPERAKRVAEMLELVRLPGMERRKPSQLSGGQRQRVALARALINHPKVLLLDEPLGALDQKLRKEMQVELKHLQRRLGITFVFVTHDQEEALTLSDRIAVFDKGKLLEVGPPKTLYEHPRTRFVADFIGINNLIEGTVTAVDAERGRLRAQTALGEWSALFTEARPAGSRCALCIRPENIDLDGGAGEELNVVPGQITFAAYLGNTLRYDVDLGGGVTFKADIRDPWHHAPLAIGAQVRLAFPAGDTVAIAAEA